MPFVDIIDPRIAPDAPVSTDLMTDIRNDLRYLNGATLSPVTAGGAPLVINSSFEIDTPGTVQPTGWTFVATGGSGQVYAAQNQQIHGSQSYQVISGAGA